MSVGHVKHTQTKTQETETATFKEFCINCRKLRVVFCNTYDLILSSEDKTEMVLDCYMASPIVEQHLQKGVLSLFPFFNTLSKPRGYKRDRRLR